MFFFFSEQTNPIRETMNNNNFWKFKNKASTMFNISSVES